MASGLIGSIGLITSTIFKEIIPTCTLTKMDISKEIELFIDEVSLWRAPPPGQFSGSSEAGAARQSGRANSPPHKNSVATTTSQNNYSSSLLLKHNWINLQICGNTCKAQRDV